MQSKYLQDFYTKIDKKAKFYSKIAKIKDYSKIPELDYDKFIDRLEDAKKYEPDAEYFYEFMQALAKECKNICTPVKNIQSQYRPEILKHACYKALEKEIKESVVTSDAFYDSLKPEAIVRRHKKVDNILSIFRECSINLKQERDLEM